MHYAAGASLAAPSFADWPGDCPAPRAAHRRSEPRSTQEIAHIADDFYREKREAVIAGVCAGLAKYFAVSPLVLRSIFILWAMASVASVAAYISLWIALPDQGATRLNRGQVVRDNSAEIQSYVLEWVRDLQHVFGAQTTRSPDRIRRVTLLGGMLFLLGSVRLVERLHLLGPFRLYHLGPAALVLMGFACLNRALRG